MVQSIDDARRRNRSGTTGRVPPHNLQAEESLLGAMLLSRDAIAAAVETCGAEDFYKPAHGHVFDAVCSLYGQGEPADPVTVADELRRADLLEAIGGPSTLISLQANTPATANAGRYARIVEEHALLRRLIGVAGEIAEIGYGMPDDVAQAIDRAESMVFEIAERRVTDTLRPLHDLLSESLDRLEALYDRGESITGVATGYLDLDERLSGLQPSNLVIVGARPSMGKTALALGMAAHASMVSRIPVLFFSLEMSHSEVTQRLLCSEARVDSSRIRNGKLMESDWPKISHAIGRLGEAPLYIDDNPNLTIMEIRAKARRLRSRLGALGLIIVDYLQLMSGRHSAENRQVEVSEISRGLKILARELEVPVVALSQLSRGLENRADKRPMLADLRESGCMPATTRLQRADSGAEVTLGELITSAAVNIPVWSLDDSGRLVPACLTHAFPSGIKPVFRLQMASGRRVDATANHRFRTPSGWTALGDLSVGDQLAVPRRLPAPENVETMDHHELIELARRRQRFIPDCVQRVPDAQVALFLRHLWAADGSLPVHRTRSGQPPVAASYGSTSRRLVDDVRRLLLRLDIETKLVTVAHGRHRLAIDGPTNLLRFFTLVGLPGQTGAALPDERQPIPAAIGTAGVRSHRLRSKSRPRAMRRQRLQAIGQLLDDTQPIERATSDASWDAVVSITPLGDKPVFDATVLGTHNFIANGVIAHNSLEQDADVVMFLYRDEVYNPESPDRGMADVIVSKHRNGPTGITQLSFLHHYTRFENMARV
ncbi:MAG: replicative DNA helicase [Actinomycetota bacterium]|nr:replicative DNA helicase [Actinomycetota bacterium]